jgi:hypothetical protein
VHPGAIHTGTWRLNNSAKLIPSHDSEALKLRPRGHSRELKVQAAAGRGLDCETNLSTLGRSRKPA